MTDIICISTTDWYEIWGSRQQIMLRLARLGYRVLFIERQVGLEHLIKDKQLRKLRTRTRRPSRLQKIEQNIWKYTPPVLPPGRYYSHTLNRLGQNILASSITKQITLLGFEDPILWVYPPQSSPLIGKFQERLAIYHCIDRFSGEQKGHKREIIEEQEHELLCRADLVFCHSQGLVDLYQPFCPHPIIFLPSAADVDHIQRQHTIQPALLRLPSPRLGFCGTLDARMDSNLLINLAKIHPEWSFIMIGPVRPGLQELPTLQNLPNMTFTGKIDPAELPSWLNGLDVFLLPYIIDERTKYINPLKIYEYMAVGKPIISVDLPEIRFLSKFVAFASTSSDFAREIINAFQTNSQNMNELRRKEALNHSWDTRVEIIQQELQEALDGKRFTS